MTTKIVFLMPERSGSTLLGRTLSACPTFHHGMTTADHAAKEACGPNNLLYVATKPPNICAFHSLGMLQPKSTTAMLTTKLSNCEFEVYADNLIDKPTPLIDTTLYQERNWNSGVAWTVEHIEHFNQLGDFKFINLVRDGRNQIASYKQRTISGLERVGEIVWLNKDRDIKNWKMSKEREEALFHQVKKDCHRFQFRARNTLEAVAKFDNYTILKYEDLVSDPRKTLKRIAKFTNIPLDIERMIKTIKTSPPNSSYRTPIERRGESFASQFKVENTLKRWTSLTQKEKEYLQDTIGQELIGLGYLSNITDTSWITEE